MKNNEIKFKYENLYQFRKEKGISQEELGNIIGVSRQAISKWETGERVPDINNLVALCKEFNKTFEDFIDLSDNIEIESNKINKKKSNKLKYLKALIIILIDIYLLIAVLKLAVIGILYIKVNKYKDSNNYSYSTQLNTYDPRYTAEYIDKTSYKDGNEKQEIQYIYSNYESEIFFTESWICKLENDRRVEQYDIFHRYNDLGEREYSFNYHKVEMFYHYSPYDAISNELKEINKISFILNPINLIRIDFEKGDLIFKMDLGASGDMKYNNNKIKIYIDLKTGLLSKKEYLLNNELNVRQIFFDYEFGYVDDSEIYISEEMKEAIHNNSLENKTTNTLDITNELNIENEYENEN